MKKKCLIKSWMDGISNLCNEEESYYQEMDRWDIQALVNNKVNGDATWNQHIEDYVEIIGENNAVE